MNEEVELVDIDYINRLKQEGKHEEADITLKVYQKMSGSMRYNRLNKEPKPIKGRNVSFTVTLPIEDVLFIDENQIKPSELLKNKIQEIRNNGKPNE
jgi:hypothetical protein